MSVRIGLLADHPHVLLPLAAAFAREWPEWYGVHGDASADLLERARRTGLPVGLVALEAGRIIGSLTIAEKSVPSHPQLSPWLIGFWVEPSRRNCGIGAQLLAASCRHAYEQGIDPLYAASAAASRLFAREGWSVIDTGTTDLGVTVNIFSKATTVPSP
jgi:GNAT superfamily N-acetyltransferase